MRYNSFEKFGVNVYEKGNLIHRKNFKSLNDAIEFSKIIGSVGYTCKFVTVDKNKCNTANDVFTWFAEFCSRCYTCYAFFLYIYIFFYIEKKIFFQKKYFF